MGDDGREPSTVYAPTKLDVRQWIRVAREVGMKYAVLTAKHNAGHCLWDADDYDYDVATSSNKTDVVAAYMAACKEYGVKPGIYYCILDGHNEGKLDGNAPPTPEYYKFVKKQLVELLTKYPGIYELWLDIVTKLSPDQRWELYRLAKGINPDIIVIMNQAFHNGSQIPAYGWPTDLANGETTFPPRSGHNPRTSIEGRDYYIPMEVCHHMNVRNWYWVGGDPARSLDWLYRTYHKSVDRNANLLLGVSPDKSGRIPDAAVKRLIELKEAIDHQSPPPVPESLTCDKPAYASSSSPVWDRFGAEYAVDGDLETAWVAAPGQSAAWLEIDLEKPRAIGGVVINEVGDRVRRFEVQYKDRRIWKTILIGGGIGPKYEKSFPAVTARFVRLNITRASDSPMISKLEVFPPAAD